HAMQKYRARAISYYIMAFQGIFPIGSLIMGAIAEWAGIRTAIYIMGGVGVLIAILYYVYLRVSIKRQLFRGSFFCFFSFIKLNSFFGIVYFCRIMHQYISP